MIFSLRSFKQRVRSRKTVLRRFLSQMARTQPHRLDELSVVIEANIWKEVPCLSCANCCKTMSPTYNAKDIRRISAHLGMKNIEFKKKWLYKDKEGDWLNKSTPCQFLDLKTNMCSIYEVRPVDCAGFPHLTKRKMIDYLHVHKQNVEMCPATYKMLEKMKEMVEGV